MSLQMTLTVALVLTLSMTLIVGVRGVTARCLEFALYVESQVMLLETTTLD